VKKTIKRMVALAFITTLISMTTIGCAGRSFDNNEVVSIVNGTEITIGFANFYARIQQAQQEMFHMAFGGENPTDVWVVNPETGLSGEVGFKESIMDSIHDMFLMNQNAGDFGVYISANDRAIIEDTAASFLANNTEDALEAISGDLETVILFIELLTIRERMNYAMGLDIDYEVSDEEALRKGMDVVFIPFVNFEEDGSSTPMNEIEIGALVAVVEGIFTELNATEGGDLSAFEGLADVTTMTFGANSMEPAPELIEAMNYLNSVGERTDIIETPQGLYIGQLTSLRDEDATNQATEDILESRRSQRFENLLNEWRQAATISVNEGVWAKVSFVRLGIEIYQSED
jgi:hypothetical protein